MLNRSKQWRDQVVADAKAINALISQSLPKPRRRKGRVAVRGPSLPVPKSSQEICKRLAIMAALDDSPERQAIIYLAVRTLQRLDLAATEAGILPTIITK